MPVERNNRRMDAWSVKVLIPIIGILITVILFMAGRGSVSQRIALLEKDVCAEVKTRETAMSNLTGILTEIKNEQASQRILIQELGTNFRRSERRAP